MISNFTFGHNVFKSRLLLMRQNASAGGKGVAAEKLLKCICIVEWNNRSFSTFSRRVATSVSFAADQFV